MTVDILLTCDYAMTSNQSKLSIVGIFDRIFVSKLPSSYSRFFIVAALKSEASTSHEVRLSLESPSGKSLLPENPVEVKFSNHGKANLITDVGNLVFSEAGEHHIKVTDGKGKVLGQYSLYINKLEAPVKGSN